MSFLFHTSGSMSGVWRRSKARLVRHRRAKAPETDRPNLNDRATPRLYPLLPVPECEEHVSRRCQRLVGVCPVGC